MAEQVCADPGTARPTVLDSLAALVEQSLIQPTAEASGEPRFGLLETIRAHALDRLESSGEATVIRHRHAQACLGLVEEAEWHLVTADRAPWLRRLDLELDNIRAALAWSLTAEGDPELGQRLDGSLAWFWYMRGRLQEGRMWSDRLAAATTTPSPGRARALFTIGGMSLMQGDAAAAHQPLESSVALFREQGDLRWLAQGLVFLAMASASLGELTLALDLYRQTIDLAHTIGDTWLEAFTLTNQGAARILVGEPAAANGLYEASLALFDKLDDAWGRSIAVRGLAGLLLDAGDYAAARARYEESVPLFRQTDDTRGLAQALLGLGKAAMRDGAAAHAEDAFTESVACWKDLGISAGVVRALSGLAWAASAQGRLERAARLYAIAAAQGRAAGVHYSDADTRDQDLTIAGLREQLEPGRFAAAWSAGQAMTLDEAIAEVLGRDHRSVEKPARIAAR